MSLEAKFQEWITFCFSFEHPSDAPSMRQIETMRDAFFAGAVIGSQQRNADVMKEVEDYVNKRVADAEAAMSMKPKANPCSGNN